MSDNPLDENFSPKFALESGGNLATIATNTATTATNTTGGATAANQVTGNTSLSTIATNTAGVATASNQTTGNTSLSTIATNTATQKASSDGLGQTVVPVSAIDLYTSGGPIDSTGKPQQFTYDRMRSLQGKALASGTITATVAGDTALAFSVAPKTIMPGQAINLYTGNTLNETVYVTTAFAVSSSATSIPLQAAVVTAGSTTAKWDIYSPVGPAANAMSGHGLGITALAVYDTGNGGQFELIRDANGDGLALVNAIAMGPLLFNGSSGDRQRGNLDNISLVASAAYTTTQTSADQTNYNGRGVIVVLDMTNVGASPSVTLEIDGKDPVSGKYYAILTGVAVTTVSTNVYTVYPGNTVTANVSASTILPRTWRVKVTANNANSGTYSVGASVIL